MKKIAVVSAVLEHPQEIQHRFNQLVSDFQGIVRGRMGIPMEEYGMALISLVVIGEMDEINSMTGKLGALKGVTVKTAMSGKSLEE